MKNGRKNTDIKLSGTGDVQIRQEFSNKLKKQNFGKEFTKELKNSSGPAAPLPAGRKKPPRAIRRVRFGVMETCRVIVGKRKKQRRIKVGKRIVFEDDKARLIALKQNESARLEKNLHHLADQKKALEQAMQNYTEKGMAERCQRLVDQIDLRMETRNVRLRSLNAHIMMLRADRYINGYDVVKKDLVNNKFIITHKQFLTLSKTKKVSDKKYKKLMEKERKAQTLSGKVLKNTKSLSKKVIQGTVKEVYRTGKEKFAEELEKQGDLGNDALKLVVESPGKILESAKTFKRGTSAVIRAPGRFVRGTWNTGKNVYKAGKGAVHGARVTVRAVLRAKRWAVAFAQSRQKAVMMKQALEQAAKATAATVKMLARTAVRIILFIIKGILSLGLPVVIIAAIIIVIAGIASAVTTATMMPYLDKDTMAATAELCSGYLTEYMQWTEEYRDKFMETDCCTDCDYDNNDTVSIQYMSGGYQTFPDKRALIVYVAACAKFGDISIVGQSPGDMESEEIRNFMILCLEYLNPTDESLITGTDKRFKEYKCRKEADEEGDYHHKHEYGDWRLGFCLRTEDELLVYLGFNTEQMNAYHSMMSEFSRQVQEENAQEVAMKGFGLTDYFDFFGGSNTSGDVLAELVELGDVELTEITEFSLQYVGNPYVWGGNSLTNGVDCSGFVKAVYEHFGVTGIPRTSAEQSKTGELVSGLNEARPGDLIFYGQPVHHVALYLGGGQIVHASNSKPYPAGGIKVSSATYSTIACIRRWVDD